MICEPDPIRLTQGSSSLSCESQYLLSWVARVSNVGHIGNDYVQVWVKVSQQCRYHWIWMPIVRAARRGHPCPHRETGRRDGSAGLIPAMGAFTVGLGGVVAPPGGGTLFLSSGVGNALGTEIFLLETETAGLVFWKTHVAKSMLLFFARFADPGSLLLQAIACIAFAQKQLW